MKREKEEQASSHDHINPLLLKLAVPLALSLAGFFIATFRRKTRTREKPPFHHMGSPDSISHYDFEDFDEEEEEEERQNLMSIQRLENAREISIERHQYTANLEEGIESVRCQVGALEERESEVASQFYNYCNMKEQESAFQKLQIMCLGFKLESLESQNQRLEHTVDEFREAMEEFDHMRGDIKLLRRKVKTLSRANRACSSLIREQEETVRINEELKRATEEIKHLADQLHKEREALEKKLEMSAAKSKEGWTKDDTLRLIDDYLPQQIQQFREQWSADMEELIYVGWIDAYIRHEVLITQEEEEEEEEQLARMVQDKAAMKKLMDENSRNYGIEFCGSDCPTSTDVIAKNHEKGLRKPRLFLKLRGWAKGRDKCKGRRS